MAPAQILDLPQTQTSYTHKKFQGNRYAHKKFGTRSPPPVQDEYCSEYQIRDTTVTTANETAIQTTTTSKRSSGDIFRPYALGDTPRKRKHHEIQEEEQHPQISSYNMDSKRFAASPMVSPAFVAPPPQVAHFPTAFTAMPPPYYRMQQFQFNAQTLALILQKQQAALCIGEILKRQQNFNLHNTIGN